MKQEFKVGDVIQWRNIETPIKYKILKVESPLPEGAILYLEDIDPTSEFKGKIYPAHYTNYEWIEFVSKAKKKVFK